jgi:hypothetical protein
MGAFPKLFVACLKIYVVNLFFYFTKTLVEVPGACGGVEGRV